MKRADREEETEALIHWWFLHRGDTPRRPEAATAFQVLRLRKLAMAQLTETELDSLGKKHTMNLSHEDMPFSKNNVFLVWLFFHSLWESEANRRSKALHHTS